MQSSYKEEQQIIMNNFTSVICGMGQDWFFQDTIFCSSYNEENAQNGITQSNKASFANIM